MIGRVSGTLKLPRECVCCYYKLHLFMSAPKKRKKIKVDTPIVFFLKYSIESLL